MFAAEPEIQKPMNMAFDASGRLWVSGSTEYPFPAPDDRKGRDSIRILEDRDQDGRADKVTVFADDLNIPIGIYPYRNGCIAFSIPYIYYLEDTDGDDRADRREILYGPLGFDRDTHGLNNAFRRGFDGWVYACHGWANHSTFSGKDGHEISLEGGNTYRMRTDGSRVEQFTWGQVNPFGMTFDRHGNLFNADCHTRPIMLLLRGGHYDSFGKPHDGLGYVPDVMNHTHGSTAIAGTTCYSGTNFPEEYRGNMFVGNVVTSRVNRDSIVHHGASVKAIEEPDFITTDDPWFRPVDLQVAPDGTLFVADFYNRIIGHVEVPLDHPGRDRKRGRIWRVIYKGEDESTAELNAVPDLRAASISELVEQFSHPNLGVRMRASDEIVDRVGQQSVNTLLTMLDSTDSPTVRVHCLWALHRLDRLDRQRLIAGIHDEQAEVRVHALRIAAESAMWTEPLSNRVLQALKDEDHLVRRVAADAIGQQPDHGSIDVLLELWSEASSQDVHLRHTIKMVLAKLLRVEGALASWDDGHQDSSSWPVLAEVALAVHSRESASFLMGYLSDLEEAPPNTAKYFSHISRHLPENADYSPLAELAQRMVADEIDLQLELLLAVQRGIERRGQELPEAIRIWGANLTRKLLSSVEEGSYSWTATTNGGRPGSPWNLEVRSSVDGAAPESFLSSLPNGEKFTGILRSRSFAIPSHFSFFLCGHLGFPEKPAIEDNFVRLRLESTGETVAQSLAPRHDVAHKIDWNLSEYAGQRGFLEIIDGVELDAFAWLAVGRFTPEVISVPNVSPALASHRQQSAAFLARTLGIEDVVDELADVLDTDVADIAARASAAEALLSFDADQELTTLVVLLRDPSVPFNLRNMIADAVLNRDFTKTRALLAEALKTAPARAQRLLAQELAATEHGFRLLLSLIEKGAGSPRLLLDQSIQQRLAAHSSENLTHRAEEITVGIPSIREEVSEAIMLHQAALPQASRSAIRGRDVFQKQCSGCHMFRGEGKVLGPQLDGVGLRGHERLLEDILDPNRNVDPQFFSTTLALDDGRVLTGLIRRQEGVLLTIADQQGKESDVSLNSIEEQQLTKNSLMPENFRSTLPAQDLYDLIEYLGSDRPASPSPISWRSFAIDPKFRSEGVTVADVNRDGLTDILVGELWYEGPDWTQHEISPPKDYGDGASSYSSAFLCFSDDIDKDGWTDQIVVGFPGQACFWYRNPQGDNRHWPKHLICPIAANESPHYVDLFGNGQRVLVMASHPEGKPGRAEMAWFAPGRDPTERWPMHPISEVQDLTGGPSWLGHGLGVADLNGDGKMDVLTTIGWWEHPEDAKNAPWPFHQARLGDACAQMFAIDLNGDQLNDVISSSAHSYGIWAHQQESTSRSDPTFIRRDLFPNLVSQTHSLQCRDIDGDGLRDLVTGKRWWAHGPSGDPGSSEPAHLYWFQAQRANEGQLSFVPHLIHADSGVGLQFVIEDLNRDGHLDIVTSNKKGVFLFEQVPDTKD